MDDGPGRAGRTLPWIASAVGVVVLAISALRLYSAAGTCPQWEDEGTMAAPFSPYAVLLCGPAPQPFSPWVVVATLALLAAAAWLSRRAAQGRLRPAVLAGAAVMMVVVPTLLLTGLHRVLPQDCLTGRSETGGCTRDRELR